jgi:putative ABC transport system permease protein
MTRSEFTENLMVSWDTLRAHKVRSGLTLLGVVIGVSSVIAVAAIIEGLNLYIQGMVEQLGSRTFFVARLQAGPQNFGRLPEKLRMRKFLNYEDGAKLREACPVLEAVTPLATRASFFGETNEIRYGAERVERIYVRGALPAYVEAIPMFAVESGRYYTQGEEDRAAAVVVIGQAIADSLFPSIDPLGRTVMLNGLPYEVVGVFAKQAGLFGGPGPDDFALIPLANYRKHNPQSKEIAIAFTVRKDVAVEAGMDCVTETLRRIRKVRPYAENDFEIFSSDFLSKLWDQLTGAVVILTSVISSIGLLVGGIGVMNIMLISVTERTKEIGVRKAIGARASDIRVQFLLEAVILTVTGGVIGVLLGAGVAWVVHALAPTIPATVSWFWAATGVILSASVGLFFGYWPANRAARLDPIVCLRYE